MTQMRVQNIQHLRGTLRSIMETVLLRDVEWELSLRRISYACWRFLQVFSWDKASGLQLARKLHGGSLSLLPVGDAATCAAARAVRAAAAACAAATAGLLPSTLEHTPDSSGGHASIAASALRFLREQPDADSSVLSSPGREEDPSRHSKAAATTVGLRAGWQADAEHLGALTWEILREGRKVIIFCPTQEWTARTASFLAK